MFKNKHKKKIDVESDTSDLPGLEGYIESFVRKFKNFSLIFLLSPIVLLFIFCLGIALWPGVMVTSYVYQHTEQLGYIWQMLCLSFAIGLGYLAYGIVLMIIVPIVNFPFIFMIRPWRGNWYSLRVLPWYVHNALTQLVRYTFLDICTPSPLTVLFFQMMGMKVGKGVLINSSNISDPCMITLGDYVTVGGSATLFGHYGQKGFLVIAPVIIKSRVTLGLKSSVMGDVIIGERTVIPPHTVLLPKSRVDETTKF